MSLFDRMGGRPQQGQPQQQGMDVHQAIAEAQRNYKAIMQQAGISVPAGMTDPEQMARYIMQSGQVAGPRLQMAHQLMARMGLK